MFMLFNRLPSICVCVGVKEMLISAFLAYHLLLSTPGSSAESMWRVKTMKVALSLCRQHMDAALSKHRAGLMGLASNNNNHTVSHVASVSQTSQKAG